MSGAPLRVVHFAAEGVFSSVLDSQVIVPLARLGQVAPEAQRGLVVLTSMRHRGQPETAQREEALRAALPGVQTRFEYRWPKNVPFEQRQWAGKLRAALRDFGFDGAAPILVHCRGEATAAAAALLRRRDRRLRIITDIRGALEDEISGGKGLWQAWTRHRATATLRAGLAAADAVNTVSHVLAGHLQAAGLLRGGVPRTVVGCCIDPERFRFDAEERRTQRAALGLDGRFVVCYCGAMWHWQRPDALAAAFAAIHADMPDAHLLVLSKDAAPLLEYLRQFGVGPEHVTTRSAAHHEVSRFLNAADAALLLREDSLTNRVASPVKFAEYVGSGVPVLLTPYVGDLSAVVEETGTGELVKFPVERDDVIAAARRVRSRLERDGDTYRAACSRLAAERFSWDAQLGELLAVYRRLARA